MKTVADVWGAALQASVLQLHTEPASLDLHPAFIWMGEHARITAVWPPTVAVVLVQV